MEWWETTDSWDMASLNYDPLARRYLESDETYFARLALQETTPEKREAALARYQEYRRHQVEQSWAQAMKLHQADQKLAEAARKMRSVVVKRLPSQTLPPAQSTRTAIESAPFRQPRMSAVLYYIFKELVWWKIRKHWLRVLIGAAAIIEIWHTLRN